MIFLISMKIPNCIVVTDRIGLAAGIRFKKLYKNMSIQSNLNGSNIFGTMEIRSRHG